MSLAHYNFLLTVQLDSFTRIMKTEMDMRIPILQRAKPDPNHPLTFQRELWDKTGEALPVDRNISFPSVLRANLFREMRELVPLTMRLFQLVEIQISTGMIVVSNKPSDRWPFYNAIGNTSLVNLSDVIEFNTVNLHSMLAEANNVEVVTMLFANRDATIRFVVLCHGCGWPKDINNVDGKWVTGEDAVVRALNACRYRHVSGRWA